MNKINLILCIHNHQPVGNFESVFEEAYKKAYLPFLDVLERYPLIKISLHYSGPIYEWLLKTHPKLIDRIKQLVKRGQVELLTGGFYEPIFPAIPDEDKIGQIKMMTEFIRTHFEVTPKGLWLPERVWEPQLVKPLKEAGVEYTLCDDILFEYAGLETKALFGHYITEDEGKPLTLFPISRKLRYLIPFAEIGNVIQYFSEISSEKGNNVIVMGDDGEKFGLWPTTYKHVYTNEWLDKFFHTVSENRLWITTMTPSEWLLKHPPQGRIYLPCGAYTEMMEWVLPPSMGYIYNQLIKELTDAENYENYRSLVKGGFWRNFLVKYYEANNIHKKMIYLSDKINHLVVRETDPTETDLIIKAKKKLYQSQCNCGYWHGIFGGVYLPHLRCALYKSLIEAEKIIETIEGAESWVKVERLDFDKDGLDEILINTPMLNLYLSPHLGGTLFELDYKPGIWNLTDVITRYEETYHKKIKESISDLQDTKNTKSIHCELASKEKGITKYLQYDWYRRVSLIDHFFHPHTIPTELAKSCYKEMGDFIGQPYSCELKEEDGKVIVNFSRVGQVLVTDNPLAIKIDKRIEVTDSSLKIDYSITNLVDEEVTLWFGIEYNLFISQTMFQETDKRVFVFWDTDHLTKFIDRFDKPTDIWITPIYTVSLSESGYERIRQGSSVIFHWKITLPPLGIWEIKQQFSFESD